MRIPLSWETLGACLSTWDFNRLGSTFGTIAKGHRVKSLEPGSKRMVLGLRMCSPVERFWTVSNPPERRLSCCFSVCCLHLPLFNCCRRYERFGKILFAWYLSSEYGSMSSQAQKKASPTEGACSLVELRMFCLKIFFIDDFVTTDQCQLLVGSGLLLYQ